MGIFKVIKEKTDKFVTGKYTGHIFAAIIAIIVTKGWDIVTYIVSNIGDIKNGFLTFLINPLIASAAYSSNYYLFTYIVTMVCIYILYYFMWKYGEANKNHKKYKSINSNNSINANNPDDMNNSIIETADNIIKKYDKNIKELKNLNFILKILSFLAVFFTLCLLIYIIIPNYIKIIFDIAITKITPYTTQDITNELKSLWVRMKNIDDYKYIDNIINEIIELNNLK